MVKIDERRFLVLFGSDLLQSFKDEFIFDIQQMSWTKIKSHGQQPAARAGFSSVMHQSKLIIFGGVN